MKVKTGVRSRDTWLSFTLEHYEGLCASTLATSFIQNLTDVATPVHKRDRHRRFEGRGGSGEIDLFGFPSYSEHSEAMHLYIDHKKGGIMNEDDSGPSKKRLKSTTSQSSSSSGRAHTQDEGEEPSSFNLMVSVGPMNVAAIRAMLAQPTPSWMVLRHGERGGRRFIEKAPDSQDHYANLDDIEDEFKTSDHFAIEAKGVAHLMSSGVLPRHVIVVTWDRFMNVIACRDFTRQFNGSIFAADCVALGVTDGAQSAPSAADYVSNDVWCMAELPDYGPFCLWLTFVACFSNDFGQWPFNPKPHGNMFNITVGPAGHLYPFGFPIATIANGLALPTQFQLLQDYAMW